MKLLRIEEYKQQNEYWDLEIDDNHNFYVNDILVHNSNASVCYSEPDGCWVQSRKNIITPEKDNAACAFSVMSNEDAWMDIINTLANEYSINLDKHIISVFFEWSGGNIQKNSALTGLDKRAMIFQYFKVSPIEPILKNDGTEDSAYWLPSCISNPHINEQGIGVDGKKYISNDEKNIYNIMNFPHEVFTIDFERPDLAQNELIKKVEEIEKSSKVGQAFGINSNIGEGFVLQAMTEKNGLLRFKVKGNLHNTGKGTYTVNTENEVVTVNNKTPSIELQQELKKQLGKGIYTFSL
jgi:hypothetical protein